MNKTELLKCVNQKGMMALVATWATAFFLGSEWGMILATIAILFAYLSDWFFTWGDINKASYATVICFLFVAFSIILSIFRAV